MLIKLVNNKYIFSLIVNHNYRTKSITLDTGATQSVLSIGTLSELLGINSDEVKSYLNELCNITRTVEQADGKLLKMYSCFMRNVDIGTINLDRFNFLTGDVSCNVLGIDFFKCCDGEFNHNGELIINNFDRNRYLSDHSEGIEVLSLVNTNAYTKYYSWFNALTEKQKEHLRYHWAVVYNCCVEGNFKDVAGILDGCVIPDYPVGNAYE